MANPPDPLSENRFARFTSDDHSAPIWIASILALVFAYIILGIRLVFVKWNMYGLDDGLLTLAHLMGLGMWASLYSSLNNGLGKTLKLLSANEISRMNQGYFASRILLYLALCLSKSSVLIFIKGIFSHTKNVGLVIKVSLGVVAAWGLAAAIAVSVGYPPDLLADDPNAEHQKNDVTLLTAITVVDVLTEIVILLLPVIPLIHIQMPWKRKALVMFAFSFRLPNIITSLMHLIRYTEFIYDGRPAVFIDGPVVWQNALLSYSFMSATIPALKGFMTRFITGGMGYTTDMSTGASGGRSGGSSGNSYQMISLKRTNKSQATDNVTLLPEGYPESVAIVTSVPEERDKGTKRRATGVSGASAETGGNENESIASHDSRKIIIRKDWGIIRA